VNRGRKQVLATFNRAKGSDDPSTEAEFGDGLLMREGYTIVAVGWEFDTPKKKGLILLNAPMATDDGKPLTGWVNPWFIPDKKSDSFEYASGYSTPVYPPLDPNDAAYRLTEREGLMSAPRLIPRKDWQFGRMENGQLVHDVNWLTLKGGFKPGMTYQVAYESENPPVAGVGFAAVRDMASALKYNADAVVHGKYVYTYGSSQVGRWQRQMIYQGFTTDEEGRQAIDAMFIQTGGASFGSFNERFAQPDELGSFTQTMFPIRYETTTDPVTGKRDGLGARVPPGRNRKYSWSIRALNTGIAVASRHCAMSPSTAHRIFPIHPTCESTCSPARNTAPAPGLPPTTAHSSCYPTRTIIVGCNAPCWRRSMDGREKTWRLPRVNTLCCRTARSWHRAISNFRMCLRWSGPITCLAGFGPMCPAPFPYCHSWFLE